MADLQSRETHASRATGRVAAGAYTVIDILDRIWRKYQRMLDKAVVKWDARRG